MRYFLLACLLLLNLVVNAQSSRNIVWTDQSHNSGGSMPCGGGDIGLNVWVEDGDLLFYLSRSGTFDENNAMLKLGRVRLRVAGRPFDKGDFKQELHLEDGSVTVSGGGVRIVLWVDVFHPVVHVSMSSERRVQMSAAYESWRYEDHVLTDAVEARTNSYKVLQAFPITTFKDSVSFVGDDVVFFHRNKGADIFDHTVRVEKMEVVKDQLYNPIRGNTFGGVMRGEGMIAGGITKGQYADAGYKGWVLRTQKAVKEQEVIVGLQVAQTASLGEWLQGLDTLLSKEWGARTDVSKRQAARTDVNKEQAKVTNVSKERVATTDVNKDSNAERRVSKGRVGRTDVNREEGETTNVSGELVETTDLNKEQAKVTNVSKERVATTDVKKDSNVERRVSKGWSARTDVNKEGVETTNVSGEGTTVTDLNKDSNAERRVSNGWGVTTDVNKEQVETTNVSGELAAMTDLNRERNAGMKVSKGWGARTDINKGRVETMKVSKDRAATIKWWQQFWERSYVRMDTSIPIARNYELFRYMLGCNAYGEWPTKFNGGLFTFDPRYVDSTKRFSPDFRAWGGGTMTAQNQRLVYFPMLKNGDGDMLNSQFDFYLRMLHNASLRSRVYWGHGGACFTEQIENFGLPNVTEYNPKRPATADPGVEYNKWLEYEWETVFEFCFMMLEKQRYEGVPIAPYLPFIDSCLTFYDAHYSKLDSAGHYILYPTSAAETYKMTYNSTTVIAAMQVLLQRLMEVDPGEKWQGMLAKVPPIPLGNYDGHTTIAPAVKWERIQNRETPQLYPVYPWGIYGIGRPGLEIALNTYRYDTQAVKQYDYVGWKQYSIFAARLGQTADAARLSLLKLADGPHRFPAFWGPGFDWTPDHNWGGSAMIGVQEMLLQVDDRKIYLLPAWPKEWDVSFKLHAPYQTTVEAVVKDGKVVSLLVTPKERAKDVIYPEWGGI